MGFGMRKKQLKRLYEGATRRNTLLCRERDGWRQDYLETASELDSLRIEVSRQSNSDKAEVSRLTADLMAVTSQRDRWKLGYDTQVDRANKAEEYLDVLHYITHAWVDDEPLPRELVDRARRTTCTPSVA